MEAAVAAAGQDRPGAALPPSWLDRLQRSVERAPLPIGAVYGLLAVVLAVVDHLLRWAVGETPFGALNRFALLEVTWAPLILGATHGLDGVARRALATIRPALALDPAAVADLQLDLTRTPPRWANLVLASGILIGGASIASSPESYGVGSASAPLAWLVAALFAMLSLVAILVYMAHALHQLRLVSRIHRDMVRIDLFRLEPLYAFASLTAWTSIGLIGITVYGVGSLSLVVGSALSFSVVDLATIGSIFVVAIASFVVPLLGLHSRIEAEKDQRRAEAGAAVAAAVAEVHARIRDGRFDGMAQVNDGLAAATSALATISKVSTWPWRPETIRGFAGAVSLPVIIWLITALLGRVI